MDNQTALTVNGTPVSVQDLLHGFKVRHGAQFLEEAIMTALIRAAAEDLPPITDEELQAGADEFRRSVGLYEVEDTHEWLRHNGLSLEDWEERLAGDQIVRRVREHVTNGKIEDYFTSNRAGFDRAVISQIVVDDEELAAELAAQITEEGADFAALAREYSLDERTRDRGGYIGDVHRQALGAEAEALIFGATAGQVVGPAKAVGGWGIFRIETVRLGQLDDATREQIKDAVFHQWLQQQRERATVETPLLDQV